MTTDISVIWQSPFCTQSSSFTINDCEASTRCFFSLANMLLMMQFTTHVEIIDWETKTSRALTAGRNAMTAIRCFYTYEPV